MDDLDPGNSDGMVDVQLPSGAVFPVYEEEVDNFIGLVEQYPRQNHFPNISDLQDLDRMMILELMVYRWSIWLSQNKDYWGQPIDQHNTQKEINDTTTQLRQLKKLLGIDKMARDKAKGEDCHDDQTEVLTERGWQLFRDVLPGEAVATRTSEGALVYEVPTAHQRYRYDGDLFVYDGIKLNFAVTPRHRMLLWANGRTYLREIRALAGTASNYRVPITALVGQRDAGVIGFEERDVSHMWRRGDHYRALWTTDDDEYLRVHYSTGEMPGLCSSLGRQVTDIHYRASKLGLRRSPKARQVWKGAPASLEPIPRVVFAKWLGLFLAEGAKKRTLSGLDHGYRVQICQSKPAAVAEIDELFATMGWPFYRRVTRRGEVWWGLRSRGLRDYVLALQGVGHELHIPDEVFLSWTREEMEALLAGLSLGDGTRGGKGLYVRYYTSSHQLASDVQRLLAHVGLSGWIHKTSSAGDTCGTRGYRSTLDGWAVSYRRSRTATFRIENVQRVPYAGMVYCLTVPNGTLLTRRNGVVMWSGNSVSAYIANLLSRAKEFGVMREGQLAKALELFQQMSSLVTLYYNCTAEERREQHVTEVDLLEWLRDVAIPEFEEIDAYFRKHSQRMWIRSQ